MALTSFINVTIMVALHFIVLIVQNAAEISPEGITVAGYDDVIDDLQRAAICGCPDTQKIQVEVPTPTILVYLVTRNWLLNCTTSVFRSFYCL